MEQQTLYRLENLAEHLQSLHKTINVARYTAPINRNDQKQKLFEAHQAGVRYEPQFTYRLPPDNWENQLCQFLADLNPSLSSWDVLVCKDLDFAIAHIKAIKSRDPVSTTEATLQVYGDISNQLVRAAFDTLASLKTESVESEPRDISADEIANQMRRALHSVGLAAWSVVVDDTMNARMSVRSVERQLKVNVNYSFTPNEFKRLLVHEIGTHVFRAVNGSLQPLKLLEHGLYNYTLTEEGLANYHEANYGLQTITDQRRYAIRVIAAHKSLTHGFYDVFCELAKHTTLEEAFDITTRAKRGFTDTGVPGCHVKDKVYFEGFRQVSAHLKQFPEDYELLMCGKVSLDALPMLKDLREDGFLDSPEYLPRQFQDYLKS